MKIYNIEAHDGETGYLVVAGSKEKAIKLVRKRWRRLNDEEIGELSVVSAEEFNPESVFAEIDWMKPRPPLLLNEEDK